MKNYSLLFYYLSLFIQALINIIVTFHIVLPQLINWTLPSHSSIDLSFVFHYWESAKAYYRYFPFLFTMR